MGTSKHHVQIHVASAEHKTLVGFLESPLKQNGIKYEIVVDKVKYHRNYPYLTVDDHILCLKRTINMCKGGTCT